MAEQTEREELLLFARELVDAAAGVILPLFRHVTPELKADGSEVTEADRRAEVRAREMIAARYPGHGIIGEEFGTDGEGRDRQWVIDPVDGTAAFALGLPVFGTLIGLLEEGEPVLGVIGLPAMGESVFAAVGAGCWHQVGGSPPVRVHARAPVPLARAYVSSTSVHGTDIESEDSPVSLINVVRRAGRVRFGADCAQHALVCRGRLDVAIDTEMSPWDIAAVVPCVEEAGGAVSTLGGRREGIVFGGSLVSSAGEPLHRELLAALARQPGRRLV